VKPKLFVSDSLQEDAVARFVAPSRSPKRSSGQDPWDALVFLYWSPECK